MLLRKKNGNKKLELKSERRLSEFRADSYMFNMNR